MEYEAPYYLAVMKYSQYQKSFISQVDESSILERKSFFIQANKSFVSGN